MTKFVKMSLVAAVSVAGLNSTVSADSLKDAFSEGVVSGQLKAQYFQREAETGTDKDSSIISVGGNLNASYMPCGHTPFYGIYDAFKFPPVK